jgi:hypothetical protein
MISKLYLKPKTQKGGWKYRIIHLQVASLRQACGRRTYHSNPFSLSSTTHPHFSPLRSPFTPEPLPEDTLAKTSILYTHLENYTSVKDREK